MDCGLWIARCQMTLSTSSSMFKCSVGWVCLSVNSIVFSLQEFCNLLFQRLFGVINDQYIVSQPLFLPHSLPTAAIIPLLQMASLPLHWAFWAGHTFSANKDPFMKLADLTDKYFDPIFSPLSTFVDTAAATREITMGIMWWWHHLCRTCRSQDHLHNVILLWLLFSL